MVSGDLGISRAAGNSFGEFQGSENLLRLIFKKVCYGELELPAGANDEVLVEELSELTHSFYLPPSVYDIADPGGTPVDVMVQGPGIIEDIVLGPQHLAGIGVTLIRRRKTGAAGAVQQNIILFFENSTSIDANLSYEVYRVSGLK